MAYVVSLRTREFGIRMALGARPSQVVKLAADEGVHLLLVGLLAGVLVTSDAERYFQSRRVLFMPNEISTLVVVLFSILIVGIVAACIPARRASRVDPNVALRELWPYQRHVECRSRVAANGAPRFARRADSRDRAFRPEHELGLFAARTRHGTLASLIRPDSRPRAYCVPRSQRTKEASVEF